MPKAVLYCRCSTEEESQKDALKQQVVEGRNTIRDNGWGFVREYIEAKSGTSVDKRQKYQQLFADLQTDDFDIVVIKSQDRLMRNTKDWYLFIDRLVTNGKRLYMYLENKFYSPDDSLITGIKAILAEEYSRELSIKINNAHRTRRKEGKSFILPKNTYGLRKVSKGKYELVKEEVKAIKIMFHMAKTCGCGVISHVLEKNGFYNRNGQPFDEEAVRRIIRNPVRYGTVVQNKRHYDFQLKREVKVPESEWVIHRDAVPACVSEKEWVEANQAMDARTIARNVKEYSPKGKHVGKYGLSGKIKCGECGAAYYRTYRKRYKDGEYIIEWKCQNYLYHGRNDEKKMRPQIRKGPKVKEKGCDNIHLNEQALFDILKQLCEQYYHGYKVDSAGIIEKTIALLKEVLKRNGNGGKQKRLVKDLEYQMSLQEKLLNKLLEDIITDDIYKKKKAELDTKIRELKEELASIKAMDDMKNVFENRIHQIRQKLESETVEKATVSEMLDNMQSILVYPTYLEIRFYIDKFLGVDQSTFQSMYELVEEMEDAFVIKFPLPEDFVYRNRKELERERIIKYMEENPCITAKEIAEKEDVSLSTANYRIKKLRQDGRIYFNGRGGCGKWVIVKNE